MKIQPSSGRVKEKVWPVLVGTASNNSAVRLLSLWGCGWAGAECGKAATRATRKTAKAFQCAGKCSAAGEGLFMSQGYH